jgi:hypothetical protein
MCKHIIPVITICEYLFSSATPSLQLLEELLIAYGKIVLSLDRYSIIKKYSDSVHKFMANSSDHLSGAWFHQQISL